MYQPPSFVVEDRAVILAALRHLAFGHLVTVAPDTGLQASAVPFLIDDELTVVRAHLARANRHWRAMVAAEPIEALLIVPGVDTYISPRWYPTKADDPRAVPTWNYELLHLRGTIRIVDDDAGKLDIVRSLTEQHESAPAGPGDEIWAVSDAPEDFIERQLRAIVGLELVIESIDAKRKLSQNRTVTDHQGVVEALSASPDPRASATGQLMARHQ